MLNYIKYKISALKQVTLFKFTIESVKTKRKKCLYCQKKFSKSSSFAAQNYGFSIWGHLFSTDAKFYKKLAFLTKWMIPKVN